ncbi:hypothetical protein Peur_003305 [Populus x canadensis]
MQHQHVNCIIPISAFEVSQGLDKSEMVGDVGSRSFYLRSSSSNRRSNGGSASSITETVSGRANPPSIPCPPFLLPEFFASKFGEIVRRTLQLWKVLVCWK